MNSIIALVALTLLIATTTTFVAAVLPASMVFPPRFQNTPTHQEAQRLQDDHGQRLFKHTTNTSVNWMNTPLYHTGQSGEKTFRQRWFYDTTFGDANGGEDAMAVLYLNGEAPCTSTPNGYLLEIANMTKAAIFVAENRWYGESLPAPLTDTELLMKSNNMSLVLADFEFFMNHAEKVLNGGKRYKWYVVGGSYSGACSAWMKARYPDRFVFSWSSSGVVHPIFDFTQFDSHIKNVIQYQCSEAVKSAFEQFSDMWDINSSAVLELLGGVPAAAFEKADTAWMLADGSAMIVQYGGKDVLCNTMLNKQKQPGPEGKVTPYNNKLYRLKHAIDTFWGSDWLTSLDHNCYYSTKCLSDPSYSKYWGAAGKTWVQQCASTFGWWNIGSHNSLRPKELLNTDYFTRQTRLAFNNSKLFPSLYTFNKVFGGVKPAYNGVRATHVIAAQGSDDPWSTAGVLESHPDYEYYERMSYCKGCGHCGDLQSPSPSDPKHLQETREWIKSMIKKFLNLGMSSSNEHDSHLKLMRKH